MIKIYTLEILLGKQLKQSNLFSNNCLPVRNVTKAPDRCVEHVLSFARSYKVAKSKSAGNVEMVMN